MADSDMNIIKPVDSLPNVASLTPTKERQQRKKRQQTFDSGKPEYREQNNLDSNVDGNEPGDDRQQHSIDYRA